MAHPSHLHLLGNTADIASDVADVVLDDTEVVENSSETQVVPDSDDDDITDTDYDRRNLGKSISFIERLAADLYKVDSQSHSICNRLDEPNMDIHDCCDQGHTSQMIACQGNYVSPIVVHSNMQEKEPSLEDANIFIEEDPHPTNVISRGLNLVEDGKQIVERKVEKNYKLSQLKAKDVHVVYTRKKNKISKAKDPEVNDVKRSSDDSHDNGGLSYVESQEPEDLSTALFFVDQFLSVNGIPISSSTVLPIKTRQNSPPSLSAKGTQSLLRWTGACRTVDRAQIFEWNDSLDGVGGCMPSDNSGQPKLAFRGKKYNHTYVRRSPSVKKPVLNADVYKEGAREDSEIEESTLKMADISATSEDLEHFFDVGVGTQIAAEAMQALSSAVCTDCGDMLPAQGPRKLPKKSGDDTQKELCAEFWSFPKKFRSAYRDISSPRNRKSIYCSDILDDMQTSTQADRINSGKLASGKCVAGRTSTDSGKVNLTKKAKAYRGEGVYSCKENFNGSLSVGDVSLCRLKNRGTIKNIHHASANLKSSSLFDMQEGLASEPMSNRVADMMSDSHNKRKGRSIMHDVLDISAEKADRSKGCRGTSLNTRDMKLNDEDKMCLVVDDSADAMLVGKKSDQMEICLHSIGKEGSTIVNPDCKLFGSMSWCLGDFPRGKRTCRSTVKHLEGYTNLVNSSALEKHDQYPLKDQSNGVSCSGSAASNSSIKRKQRSTIYVRPRLLSSKKSESPITGLDSIVYDTGCEANDNLSSHNPVSYSCQASPSEINSTHSVDVYHQQNDKKKPLTTALTRELLRLGFTKSMPDFTTKFSRRRKTMTNIRVLLSKSLNESTRKHQIKILSRFGVPIASCPSNATHFVTDRFARTTNMLEFIAEGKPVVTHQWLESCDQAGFCIDYKDYIVRDVKKEHELGFRLPTSLDRARHHPLLQGYRVFITDNAKPGKDILANLVKAAHGEVVNVIIDSKLDNLLILSCDEDEVCCSPLIQRGTSAYSPELLLNGIIIQKLEFARHRLFKVQESGQELKGK